jgi:hypothetical protein
MSQTQVQTIGIAADAVTADKIATGAVGTTEIANGAVTAAKIATAAVGTTEIASGVTITGTLDGNAASVTNGVYTTNFASSLGGNGYQRLPGGLIIQWGQVGFMSGIDATRRVTFSIQFTSAVYAVTVTPNSAAFPAGNKSDSQYTFNQDRNGFTLLSRQENSGCSYSWIAIGA